MPKLNPIGIYAKCLKQTQTESLNFKHLLHDMKKTKRVAEILDINPASLRRKLNSGKLSMLEEKVIKAVLYGTD